MEDILDRVWGLITENGSCRVLRDGTMFYSEPGSSHIDVYVPDIGTYRLMIEPVDNIEGCFV